MGMFDQVMLLATGLVAIYLIWRFWGDFRRSENNHRHAIYYMTSFAVLLVAGLLLIIFGYDALKSPLVVIVGALIPLALATGLVAEFYPSYERPYLTFAVIGLLAIAITRFVGPYGLATAILATVHGIAGLTICGLPLVVVRQDKVSGAFSLVTVGGALIGIGGLALAFLKAGVPILPASFIFAILAPLLFLMASSFAWGFVKKG